MPHGQNYVLFASIVELRLAPGLQDLIKDFSNISQAPAFWLDLDPSGDVSLVRAVARASLLQRQSRRTI